MKGIVTQIRLIGAEALLNWAMLMAPKNHPDGIELVKAVADYLKKVVTTNPK